MGSALFLLLARHWPKHANQPVLRRALWHAPPPRNPFQANLPAFSYSPKIEILTYFWHQFWTYFGHLDQFRDGGKIRDFLSNNPAISLGEFTPAVNLFCLVAIALLAVIQQCALGKCTSLHACCHWPQFDGTASLQLIPRWQYADRTRT